MGFLAALIMVKALGDVWPIEEKGAVVGEWAGWCLR
jgi:hypothetical protein